MTRHAKRYTQAALLNTLWRHHVLVKPNHIEFAQIVATFFLLIRIL